MYLPACSKLEARTGSSPDLYFCTFRAGTSISRGVLSLFGFPCALFLHLLYRLVVLVSIDGLFTRRGQLGLPLAFSRLGFVDAVGLVSLDVARSLGVVFVVCVSGMCFTSAGVVVEVYWVDQCAAIQ